MGESTLWVIESVDNEKFPYRLTIRQGDKVLLALRVQDKWPGQKGNIFCIREERGEWEPPLHEIERVQVVSIRRFGKRLAVVLDRARNKRCDFLFLTKKYKTKEGEYEQIFWRTEKALRERTPRVKLSTYYTGQMNIAIDTGERYPWRFPGCHTERKKLPVGDYALIEDDEIIALVERKTYDNLLAEFGRMAAFHQQLNELSAYKISALVIEANYSDFLKKDRLRYYNPGFAAKAIGELYALHPGLTIVFAGNRKLAMEWTFRFFSALIAHEADRPHMKVAEVMENYGATPATQGGTFFEIRRAIKNEFPEVFSRSDIKQRFPDVSDSTITRVLNDLKRESLIRNQRRGRLSVWVKEVPDANLDSDE